MSIVEVDAPEWVFDELLNTPVSDREWVETLVSGAAKHKTMCSAMAKVFGLGGIYLSPNKWDRVRAAAQRLNPKPPEFIHKTQTTLLFICDNFANASLCIFANKEKEAVDWILSGRDRKRVALPKKKPTRARRDGARLMIGFRERDDSTAWHKCK